MHWIPQVLFILALGVAIFIFYKNVTQIRKNINLGRDEDLTDRKAERWKTMFRVALGQGKMGKKPIAGILHVIVYVGFVLINIEVLEIIIDGIFNTHRSLSFLGGLYDVAIGFFEILAVLVLLACVLFLTRRYISKVPRISNAELEGWPQRDATSILVIEIVLMVALLTMNATDQLLQQRGEPHYFQAGAFPISMWLTPLFDGLSTSALILVERAAWWFHILGILAFLNYLPFSKHFHIILAFPNTWYSRLDPKGTIPNMESVTNEVKMMMDPASANADAPPPESFGAKDVKDLSWKNLMDAYSCTECGRCTSACPANITGKKLSPRGIMMKTRDRLEEVGKNIKKNGADYTDDKDLHSYISQEELLACTTCNACVEECPVNINPLDIIMQMRQYQMMEKAQAPNEWNMMATNMENNGAPWQFPASDRDKWKEEV